MFSMPMNSQLLEVCLFIGCNKMEFNTDKSFAQLREENTEKLNLVKASSIRPRKVNWLIKNRIPRGKITLFAGEGGIGKSTVLMGLASLVSRGRRFIMEKEKIERGNVVVLSAEDNEEDTLAPRLIAAKADMDNVYFLKGTKKTDSDNIEYYDEISLDRDILRLEAVLKTLEGVSCVIIDPISAYLGDINEYKNSEVRALLSKLTIIAEKYNCALILNTHLSKPNNASKASAANRVTGSIAYVNASRAAYLIIRDPNNPNDRCLILPIKNNNGDDKTGFAYKIVGVTIDEDIETTRAEFFNELITESANEILEKDTSKETPGDEARKFLLDILSTGSKPVKDIIEEAQEIGISIATLYRVKKDLKITEERSSSAWRNKIWYLTPASPDK